MWLLPVLLGFLCLRIKKRDKRKRHYVVMASGLKWNLYSYWPHSPCSGLTLHPEALWQSRSDEEPSSPRRPPSPPPLPLHPALDAPFVWCLMTAVMEPSCSVITRAHSEAFLLPPLPLCSFFISILSLHQRELCTLNTAVHSHSITTDLRWHHIKSHFKEVCFL